MDPAKRDGMGGVGGRVPTNGTARLATAAAPVIAVAGPTRHSATGTVARRRLAVPTAAFWALLLMISSAPITAQEPPMSFNEGCADGSREGLGDFQGVAACAGSWKGHISNASALCAPGWHVCDYLDHNLLYTTVTFEDATSFPGCFAYNASQDFDDCNPCFGGLGYDDMAGMGADCTYKNPGATSCGFGGRIDSGCCDPLNPACICTQCAYSTAFTGAVCCAGELTGLPPPYDTQPCKPDVDVGCGCVPSDSEESDSPCFTSFDPALNPLPGAICTDDGCIFCPERQIPRSTDVTVHESTAGAGVFGIEPESCPFGGGPIAAYSFRVPLTGEYLITADEVDGLGVLFARDTWCFGTDRGCIPISGSGEPGEVVSMNLGTLVANQRLIVGVAADCSVPFVVPTPNETPCLGSACEFFDPTPTPCSGTSCFSAPVQRPASPCSDMPCPDTGEPDIPLPLVCDDVSYTLRLRLVTTPTPTNTVTVTATPTRTKTPTATFTRTQTRTVTETASFTPTRTPTRTPADTPTDTPSYTPTHTPTVTRTITPTDTPTHTPTHTPSHTPMHTPTRTPTNTPVATRTHTPTDTPTNTPTHTPTHTPTQTPTHTPTNTPVNTATHTPTETRTDTPTDTPTPTPTDTPADTPTDTPTGTATDTPTHTATVPSATTTATATAAAPTATATITDTPMATATATGPTPTATATATGPTPTATATATGPTPTATATATGPTPTATATATGPTPTATATSTGMSTPTATATSATPAPSCVGDCDGDGVVEITDIVTCTRIIFEYLPLSACPGFDADGDGFVLEDLYTAQKNVGEDPCPR